jgi:hypothetical protein
MIYSEIVVAVEGQTVKMEGGAGLCISEQTVENVTISILRIYVRLETNIKSVVRKRDERLTAVTKISAHYSLFWLRYISHA